MPPLKFLQDNKEMQKLHKNEFAYEVAFIPKEYYKFKPVKLNPAKTQPFNPSSIPDSDRNLVPLARKGNDTYYYDTNGVIEERYYENGKLIKKRALNKNTARLGQVVVKTKIGLFVGDVRNNKINGIGTYYYENGEIPHEKTCGISLHFFTSTS